MTSLSCARAAEVAARAELGDASEAERIALDLHVEECAACGAERRRLQAFVKLLRVDADADPGISDRAIASRAIMQAGAVAPRLRSRWSPAVRSGLAIAAAALLVVTTTLVTALLTERGPPVAAPTPAPAPAPVSVLGSARHQPCPGVIAQGSSDARAQLLETAPDRCRIALDAGDLSFHVERSQHTDLRVATPHADIRVIGTVLLVRVDASGTTVIVERGLVELRAGGRSATVGAHQRALLGPSGDIDVRAAVPASLAVLVELARDLGLDPPAPITVTEDQTDETDEPQTDEPQTDEPQTDEPQTDEAASPTRRVARLRRLLGSERPSVVRERAEDEMRDPRLARRRMELLTIIAESYAVEGDYSRALDTYTQVWRGPRTTTASNALIAGGDLALFRLHDPERARGLYERYLREYPQGSLREIATVGRCRALAELGAAEATRRCIDGYHDAYPSGRLAAQLEPHPR